MREPFKVGVWGPGLVGGAALREVIRLPEFELAAVRVYSPEKDGVDAGALVGLERTGVSATTDVEVFMGAEMECVIYTARDYGDPAPADADIVALLEAGVNVVTTLPYHYPKARGQEIVDRLEAACARGASTLFASGLFPGYIVEHVAMSLTVAVDNLEHLRVQETFEASGLGSPEMLAAFGWGQPYDPENTASPAYVMSRNYYRPIVQLLGDKFGLEYDRIDGICKSIPADRDIQVGELTIRKGTVAAVSYAWTGYVNGEPRVTIEPYWYMTEELQLPEATSLECWIITIEGTPSLQAKVNARSSFRNDGRLGEQDPTFAGYYLSSIPAVRAIPSVIAANPGLKIIDLPDQRWKRDLRLDI